jgi:hypothetical protein
MGAATLLSSHAEDPRPATSDTTKGSHAPNGADSLKESQLAAGRDHPFSVGHHRPGNQNSKPGSDVAGNVVARGGWLQRGRWMTGRSAEEQAAWVAARDRGGGLPRAGAFGAGRASAVGA